MLNENCDDIKKKFVNQKLKVIEIPFIPAGNMCRFLHVWYQALKKTVSPLHNFWSWRVLSDGCEKLDGFVPKWKELFNTFHHGIIIFSVVLGYPEILEIRGEDVAVLIKCANVV